jgi:hypothetical protein
VNVVRTLNVVQSQRFRWLCFAVIVLLATALAAVFILRAVADQHRQRVPTAATKLDQALDLGSVLDRPHIVFRSTSPGPTFGRLAAVPLNQPGGKRSVSDLSCDRVFATAKAGICLIVRRGALMSYRADLLDARMVPSRQFSLGGVPSRARLSPDSSLAATTVFVSGHSYATMGFSTETRIVDRGTGHDYGNLEKTFTVSVDPRRNHAPDLNIWGVTFPAGPRPTTFYATVGAGGLTWLIRGDLTAKTLTAIHSDAECPSLSPDGRTLVYKKRAGSPIRWRYHALDLATGGEWALPEIRSIDDQVEWLDDTHVLYGLPRNGGSESDIWVSDLKAGQPRILVRDASSPAVVR